MVYTRLTRRIGVRIGKVIFQNFSQAVHPSISAASYREGDTDCSPARKRRICTPERHDSSKMLLAAVVMTVTISEDSPA